VKPTNRISGIFPKPNPPHASAAEKPLIKNPQTSIVIEARERIDTEKYFRTRADWMFFARNH
jgi:hypothetical protein